MDTLKEIVYQVVAEYAKDGLNCKSYLTQNVDQTVLTVVDIARIREKYIANVSLVVRIVNDLVIVERDQNDKIVRDALLQAGIRREKNYPCLCGRTYPRHYPLICQRRLTNL